MSIHVACIGTLNRRPNRHDWVYVCVKAFLCLACLARLFTSGFRTSLRFLSRLVELTFDRVPNRRAISRSGSSSFAGLIPAVLSRILLAPSFFRLLPLSSWLYDFSVSVTSVSFTRILSISQRTKERRWNIITRVLNFI